jgi:hypothetical protein
MIVYCAADLLWATRIKGTAEAMGIACRPVRTIDMLEARLAEGDVKGLIVDLDAGKVGLEMIRALREQGQILPSLKEESKVRIVAFGPHIAVDLLEMARAAGADEVLPRGAFDRKLPHILQALQSREANG